MVTDKTTTVKARARASTKIKPGKVVKSAKEPNAKQKATPKATKNTKTAKTVKSKKKAEDAESVEVTEVEEVKQDADTQTKTGGELSEIYDKMKEIWDRNYWCRSSDDVLKLVGYMTEYRDGGKVFSSEDYDKIDLVFCGSAWSYRGNGINAAKIFPVFVEFYNKHDYPDERMSKFLNKSRTDVVIKAYLQKHGNKIDLDVLVQLTDKTVREVVTGSIGTDNEVEVVYDQQMMDRIFDTSGMTTKNRSNTGKPDKKKGKDGDSNNKKKVVQPKIKKEIYEKIPEDVYKLVISQGTVKLTTDFVKTMARFGPVKILDCVAEKFDFNEEVLEAACLSDIDRLDKVRRIIGNKVTPDARHYEALLESTEHAYYYECNRRLRNNDKTHDNNEDDTRDCIEELIAAGYSLTYENMLECLRINILFRDIERFEYGYDDQYIMACVEAGVYPYNVDITPGMSVLEKACEKSGNLKAIKKVYADIDASSPNDDPVAPSTKCIENACKHKNNRATVKFLVSKGAQLTESCLKSIAGDMQNQTLSFIVDAYTAQMSGEKVPDASTDSTSDDTTETSVAEASVAETSVDSDADLEKTLEEAEAELKAEGVEDAIIEYFKPIPDDYDMYAKLWGKIDANIVKALRLTSKSHSDINLYDLTTIVLNYTSLNQMIKPMHIEIDESNPFYHNGITKIDMDDIHRWLYARIYEEIDESSTASSTVSACESDTNTEGTEGSDGSGIRIRTGKTDTVSDNQSNDSLISTDSNRSAPKNQPRKRVPNRRIPNKAVSKATPNATPKTGTILPKRARARVTAKTKPVVNKAGAKRAMVKGKSASSQTNSELLVF